MKKSSRICSNPVLSIALVCMFAASILVTDQTKAETITIDANARGWVDNFNNSSGTNASNIILVGKCLCVGDEHRNWFRFPIPALDGPISSAELVIDSRRIFLDQEPSTTYTLTSLGVSRAFRNVGTGDIYGAREYQMVDDGTTQSIPLNQAALAAIDLSQGGSFGISGRLTENATFNPGDDNQFLFGSTVASLSQLRITTVPEPNSALLFGLMFTACVAINYRQSHRR